MTRVRFRPQEAFSKGLDVPSLITIIVSLSLLCKVGFSCSDATNDAISEAQEASLKNLGNRSCVSGGYSSSLSEFRSFKQLYYPRRSPSFTHA